MNNNLERVEREDVVSVYSGQIFVNNRTFTLNEFITAFMPIVKEKSAPWTEDKEKWFNEGLDCKILKPGAKSWRRGKVRISLEFEPEALEVADAPESSDSQASSPLDDIRQRMPKDN
jgi:hypothetical protein